MPSPGQLAPTRRMTKGTRTQRLPARLPFKTDGPTTGARHEYQHCWPLWQPNQTAHFPALAITRVSGLCSQPNARAFAQYQPKTHKCLAINADIQRPVWKRSRAGKPVRWRPARAVTNCNYLLKPAQPVLRTPTIMGNGQNLKTIRHFSVNDRQGESVKGRSANIW